MHDNKSESVTPSDREIKELKALEAGIGFSSDKTIALYLGAGRSTIWKWVRDKKLPPPRKLTKSHSRWSNVELLPILREFGKGCEGKLPKPIKLTSGATRRDNKQLKEFADNLYG